MLCHASTSCIQVVDMERNTVKNIIALVSIALLMPVLSCTLAVTLHRAAASGDVGAINRMSEHEIRISERLPSVSRTGKPKAMGHVTLSLPG